MITRSLLDSPPVALATMFPADEPQTLITRPLAYGYMRVPREVSDDKVRRLEQAVIRFAEGRGLYFVSFFFEFHCGSREAFDELVTELVRAQSHHVMVPTMRHLARNGLLQDVMRDRLFDEAGADVLALRPRVEAPSHA
ncbi:recombinase family protein [Amycolatopsis azurea]|uniref:recombinase family protein n=1 Tax=Amycolatopsis azurea TaxID=36819 RepID=UPI003803284E